MYTLKNWSYTFALVHLEVYDVQYLVPSPMSSAVMGTA